MKTEQQFLFFSLSFLFFSGLNWVNQSNQLIDRSARINVLNSIHEIFEIPIGTDSLFFFISLSLFIYIYIIFLYNNFKSGISRWSIDSRTIGFWDVWVFECSRSSQHRARGPVTYKYTLTYTHTHANIYTNTIFFLSSLPNSTGRSAGMND